jgi:tellurite resistance protein
MSATLNATRLREILHRAAGVDLPSSAGLASSPEEATRYMDLLAEASFLVSGHNHHRAPAELSCMLTVLTDLSSGALSRSEIAGMFYEFAANLERDGLDARLAAVAGAAGQKGWLVVSFAALVAMSDGELHPAERKALLDLARGLGVEEKRVDAMVGELRTALGLGQAS